MRDTRLRIIGWTLQLCALVAGMIALYLAHAFFFKSPERPWIGYARHIESGRPEFWYNDYETRRDCLEAMTHGVGQQIEPIAYSMPVGCRYVGDNSWLVRAVNLWSVGDDLHCISRVTRNIGDSRYRPVLNRLADMPMRGTDWYCL